MRCKLCKATFDKTSSHVKGGNTFTHHRCPKCDGLNARKIGTYKRPLTITLSIPMIRTLAEAGHVVEMF